MAINGAKSGDPAFFQGPAVNDRGIGVFRQQQLVDIGFASSWIVTISKILDSVTLCVTLCVLQPLLTYWFLCFLKPLSFGFYESGTVFPTTNQWVNQRVGTSVRCETMHQVSRVSLDKYSSL